MLLFVMHLKYADWRRAFLRAWADVGKLRRGQLEDVDCRADALLQALEATCLAMHTGIGNSPSKEAQAWSENLGHKIAFVSSPLSLLGRLGVVKKCPLSKSALCVGVDQQTKFGRRLCSKRERKHVKKSLARWVKFADSVGEVEAPRTCRAWVEQFQSIQDKMRKHKPALLRHPSCTHAAPYMSSGWGVEMSIRHAGVGDAVGELRCPCVLVIRFEGLRCPRCVEN